ncbi:ABC transporter permease subunit [bacterium]|nr:ABC transporter permease subunit [bacterium]
MQIKEPQFFGIHANPNKFFKKFLPIAPFLLILCIYMSASYFRHQENPQDKILPTITQMKDSTHSMLFKEDVRTGAYLMMADTKASLKRLLIGVFMSAIVGLFLGLNIGLFPGLTSLAQTFMTFLSIVPPLAILPILFIAFGVEELAKIMLIFVGTFPLITRSIFQFVSKIPKEQVTKAFTLGATQLQVAYRVIMPQIMPRLIDNVRLSFGAGWLFLIAAEAIASTEGLGYRIFLVRRYLAMDIIIPYTLWITFLGFSIDWGLRKFVEWKYPWYAETK